MAAVDIQSGTMNVFHLTRTTGRGSSSSSGTSDDNSDDDIHDSQGVAEEGYREGSQCLRVLCGKVSSSSSPRLDSMIVPLLKLLRIVGSFSRRQR